MVSSSSLDQMYNAGISVSVLAFLGFLVGSAYVGDLHKRLMSFWSALATGVWLVSWVYMHQDAGLKVRDDGAVFAQPIWLAFVAWTVFTAIRTNIAEHISKHNGIANVIAFLGSGLLFFYAGRENVHDARWALYGLAWIPFVASVIITFAGSRVRTLTWVDSTGQKLTTPLPLTMMERVLTHVTSAVSLLVFMLVGIVFGLGSEMSGRLPSNDQQIAYFVVFLVSIAQSALYLFVARQVEASSGKQE